MRVIYLLLVSFFVSLNAWADNSFEPLLNTVTLELNPEQHYYIHNIDFVGRMAPPTPQPMMYKTGSMVAMASNAANISVGNKLFINATVVLASAPSPDVTKIVHA